MRRSPYLAILEELAKAKHTQFNLNDRPSRRRFELLIRAYIEARYSKHYKITQEELAWLAGCVEQLIEVVDAVCADGIDGRE